MACLIRKIRVYRGFEADGRSPYVSGLLSPKIHIPEGLNLTEGEYEAVLAHEKEHIRFKDNWARLLLELIEALFWWVPTRGLHRRIEEGQEVGADKRVKDPLDLATAILKCARHTPGGLSVQYLAKHPVRRRIEALLYPKSARFRNWRIAFLFTVAITLLFGRYWIF